MAVKGSLKAGGFADALQIVAETKQSCVIRTTTPDGRYEIHCRGGQVVRATPQGADADERLGDALVRSGAASREEVELGFSSARRGNEDLPAAMAERMDRDELRQFLYFQIVDVVHLMFGAAKGKWELDTTEGAAKRWGFEAVDAHSLIDDGRRLVDEWPVIRSVVDSPRLRFKKIREIGDALGGGLGANDHFVFTLVRDDRDVRDIEHLARIGWYEAQRALYQLASEGYIVPKGLSPEVEGPVTKAMVRDARRLRRVHATSHLGVLILVAVAGMYGARRALRPPPAFVSGAVADIDNDLQAVLGANQRARIGAAIEVYALHKGGYPDSLQAVVAAGLLNEDDLTYPMYDEPYVLQRDGERSFILTAPLR